MAKTNRNKKLPLSEAWQHYWSTLFSGGDWSDDLICAIRYRICLLDKAPDFPSGKGASVALPDWTESLKIALRGSSVSVSFNSESYGTVPLFGGRGLLVLSNWRDCHPFEQPQRYSDLKQARRDLVISAVWHCGNEIVQRFMSLLGEIDRPTFDIYCRPHNDVFSKERKLPSFAMTQITGMDIYANTLTDRMGIPMFDFVHVRKRPPSTAGAGPKGSFDEADAVLIEKMKRMIDTQKVKSARQAAMSVAHEAAQRKGASQESVINRLQRKFGKQYPNYTK